MLTNTKVVFSKELANILVNRGFSILRTEINLRDPKFKVFVFENSPELMAAIEEYKSNRS